MFLTKKLADSTLNMKFVNELNVINQLNCITFNCNNISLSIKLNHDEEISLSTPFSNRSPSNVLSKRVG